MKFLLLIYFIVVWLIVSPPFSVLLIWIGGTWYCTELAAMDGTAS
jgi:hypothetical protein